jgi:hypothetical protein
MVGAMSDTRTTTEAPQPLTLYGYLAARHAQMLLADAAAQPTGPAAPTPDDATLAEAAQMVAHLDLSPAKLALLRASLASFDVEAAARRLTATQAQAMLAQWAGAARRARGARDARDALTVEALDALTPDAWVDFARWLLEQEGARLEPRPFSRHEGLVAWRAEQGQQQSERRLVVCAWRVEPGWPLLEDDLRRMAALTAGEPGAQLVIVTTAEATVGARLAAQRIGGGDVRFIDRPALAETLARLATAYQREQERTQGEAKTRAKAATAARKTLLAALATLDEQARAESSATKAAGRPAVRKAAAQVEQARRLAAQALIAWETLLAEWIAAFGERPARDGSLALDAEATVYSALAERADHLKKPLLDALRALAKTPGEGDLGYGPWRLAIGEELAARCSALHWRGRLVDPAQWQDYSQAVNDLALQEATRAENATAHAAARAERARSQLVERIGAL